LGLGSQRLADGAAGLDDSKTMLSALLTIPMLVPQPGREPDIPSPAAGVQDVDGASDSEASGRAERRTIRLAKQRADLARVLERMESSPLPATLYPALARVIAAEGTKGWVGFEGWASRCIELAEFLDWNGAGSLDGKTAASAERNLEAIASLARTLESRGIEFLVVPVPKRIQVYPDRIPGVSAQSEFTGFDPAHARFLLELTDAGVEVLDLLPLFASRRYGDPEREDMHLFHDYDQHWTPRGVALAADAIAEWLRVVGVQVGPAKPGVDFLIRREQAEYTFRHREFAEVTKEPVELWFDRVLGSDGEKLRVKDRASEILVLGDSFSHHLANEQSGLVRLLYARMRRPLDAITIPSGGAHAVWSSLARREHPLAGKRAIVWVFAARVLTGDVIKLVDLSR